MRIRFRGANSLGLIIQIIRSRNKLPSIKSPDATQISNPMPGLHGPLLVAPSNARAQSSIRTKALIKRRRKAFFFVSIAVLRESKCKDLLCQGFIRFIPSNCLLSPEKPEKLI
jgi:hypothetical protein